MKELRVKVRGVLRHFNPPKPNMLKEEWRVLQQLKADKEG